jgi:hypothetical protein
MHQMRCAVRLLNHPPYGECNGRPCEDRLEVHSASLEAQTSAFFEYPHYPSPEPGLDGGPGRRGPAPLLSYLLQYARNATRYACAWLRVCRPAGKYAAACGRLEGATPASVRQTR